MMALHLAMCTLNSIVAWLFWWALFWGYGGELAAAILTVLAGAHWETFWNYHDQEER